MEHHILLIKGYDAIRPKLNCFILMIISVAKLSGFPPLDPARPPEHLLFCGGSSQGCTDRAIIPFDGAIVSHQKESSQGANPQRVSIEIIIEIKQLYSGRMASNPFIPSNRRYMVFPLRDHFFVENGL